MDLVIKLKVRVSDEVTLERVEEVVHAARTKLMQELGDHYQEEEAPLVQFSPCRLFDKEG
jgi:hypothetical protein